MINKKWIERYCGNGYISIGKEGKEQIHEEENDRFIPGWRSTDHKPFDFPCEEIGLWIYSRK